MQIQILTINKVAKPTKVPGKTTPALDIAYKNLSFQGKVEGRVVYSFGGNKGGYDTLVNAVAGQVYDITVVKNDGGFNDWTFAILADIANPGSSEAAKDVPARTISSGLARPAASPKSTYETPEERALKQIYIVRQSSISNAIDLLSVGSKATPKVEDVIDTAKKFEAFVFAKEPLDVTTAFDDLESDDFPDIPH